MKKFIIISLLVLCFSLLTVSQIQAASPSPSPSPSPTPSGGGGTSVSFGGLSPVGEETTVPQIIGNVVKAVLGVVGALALFMVVYGGIILLSSAGKQDQIKKGKDVLIWATIGVAVILGSYVLVDFIIAGISGEGGSSAPTTPGTAQQDTCGKTSDTMGYSCRELSCNADESLSDCADRQNLDCKSGYCMSQPSNNLYTCCKAK